MFEICDYWLDDFRDELDRRGRTRRACCGWRPRLAEPAATARKPLVDQEGRALEALEHVHTHDVTGPTADKALFWCGYVNFIRGNFNEADHFFSQLVEMHKDSPLRPQAMAFAIQAKNNATGGAVYDGRKCAEALHLVHVAEATVPELTQRPGDGREADAGEVRDPLAAGREGLPDGRVLRAHRAPGLGGVLLRTGPPPRTPARSTPTSRPSGRTD